MNVRFFDSFDAMLATVREARAAADARVMPWQHALGPGDCALVMPSSLGGDVAVYVELLDIVAIEKEHGAGDAELAELAARYAPAGPLRFGRHYSALAPDGDLGTLHVGAVVVPLSRGAFEKARVLGWPSDGVALRAVLMRHAEDRKAAAGGAS